MRRVSLCTYLGNQTAQMLSSLQVASEARAYHLLQLVELLLIRLGGS